MYHLMSILIDNYYVLQANFFVSFPDSKYLQLELLVHYYNFLMTRYWENEMCFFLWPSFIFDLFVVSDFHCPAMLMSDTDNNFNK